MAVCSGKTGFEDLGSLGESSGENKIKIEDRGSTGRIEPQNLQEQLAMKEVKAAVKYYRSDLSVPSQVEEATAKYKSENDVVGGFVFACLEKCRNSTIQATKLYKIFQKYCLDNDYEVISQTAFSRKMKEEKIVKRKDGIGIICYQDICLTEQGEVYEEDYAKHWDERYR